MAISIIIPVFNEERYIAETVNTIHKLLGTYIIYDLIIINNASTDNTEYICSSFDDVLLINLDKKVTISSARNIGVNKSNHNIIVFLDADVLITPQWRDELLKQIPILDNNHLQITGCRYNLSKNPSFIELVWFANLKKSSNKNNIYINSGNLITTRMAFEIIGGFDETLITGEDVDFCIRAVAKGIQININTNFSTHHEGYPQTICEFMQRERWHGVGDLKSFNTFIKSKIALFSFLIISLVLSSVILFVTGNLVIASVILSFALLLNMYAIIKRFHLHNFSTTVFLFFIHFLYCFSRFSSLVIRNKV